MLVQTARTRPTIALTRAESSRRKEYYSPLKLSYEWSGTRTVWTRSSTRSMMCPQCIDRRLSGINSKYLGVRMKNVVLILSRKRRTSYLVAWTKNVISRHSLWPVRGQYTARYDVFRSRDEILRARNILNVCSFVSVIRKNHQSEEFDTCILWVVSYNIEKK